MKATILNLLLGSFVAIMTVGFDNQKPGVVPDGWTAAHTGKGTEKWTVEKDATAPSAPMVLKQSGVCSFSTCVKNDTSLVDGFAEVKFKPLSGKVDESGGLVWRYQDPKNYYVVRANALEDNVVLYKMENGKRSSLPIVGRKGGYGVKAKVAKDKWQTLRVEFVGDTFAAMSVCDPVGGMHHLFTDLLMPQLFVSAPRIPFAGEWDESEMAEMAAVLEKRHQEIAAVILEPVVQGAGGMRFYHPNYLLRVRELCDEYGLLLIADEIATGFGRSGKMFACEHAGIVPDIMCLGKALTGGYLSFAATLVRGEVARGISENDPGVLMHGPTFMANPLACAVARASLELLEESPWAERVARIEAGLRRGLEPCRELPGVRDVRVLGAIGVVETEEPVDVAGIQSRVVEQGVWLRPFARLCYTMPPFIASDAEVEQITAAMCRALAGNGRRTG